MGQLQSRTGPIPAWAGGTAESNRKALLTGNNGGGNAFLNTAAQIGSQAADALNPLGGVTNIITGLLDPDQAARQQQIANGRAQAQRWADHDAQVEQMHQMRDRVMARGGQNPLSESTFDQMTANMG